MTMDGSGAMATHTYAMGGDYTITLTVKDVDGLEDTETALVHIEGVVDPYPVASFTATMDWMTVTVISTSTDNLPIPTTSWAFGDGATATGLTATHTYAALGLWTITLTVTDSMGQMDTATQQVEAKLALPLASFTQSVVKRDVSVDGSASSDPDGGAITAWSWNWGDGSTLGSGAMATHLYASIGTFTITLTVTDDDGQTGSSSQQVTTTDSPPVAAFTVSVSGLTVNVNAAGSTDDYPGLTYAWSWGDGTTGTGVTAMHTYGSTPAAVSPSVQSTGKVPPPPFWVMGQTKDSLGNIVSDCAIMVTNMRTGAVNYTTSDTLYGYYEFNLNDQIGGVAEGDMIKVTATKGTMSGEATGQALYAVGFVFLNVVLTAGVVPYDVTITLTVTDSVGQIASVSKTVTVTP
jgi:PKD repeat protein